MGAPVTTCGTVLIWAAESIGLTLNPFLLANSGQPFNITIGRDLNGDSIFNDRPAFATDLARASVVKTRHIRHGADSRSEDYPAQPWHGPPQFTLNLRLMKRWALGNKEISEDNSKENGEGFFKRAWQPLYTIRFEVFANNLLNHVNLALPVGNLSSPLFGRSVALAVSALPHPGAITYFRFAKSPIRRKRS
jgi:hypothetical protein